MTRGDRIARVQCSHRIGLAWLLEDGLLGLLPCFCNEPSKVLQVYEVVSKVEMEELRALSDAATPGLWEARSARSGALIGVSVTAPDAATDDGSVLGVTDILVPEDAKFIVAAANFVRRCTTVTPPGPDTATEETP